MPDTREGVVEEIDGPAETAMVGQGTLEDFESAEVESWQPFADDVHLARYADPRAPRLRLVERQWFAQHQAVRIVVPDRAVEEIQVRADLG
jgi:hypothetical protein